MGGTYPSLRYRPSSRRPFQIEAIFIGQAGLLDIEAVPEHYQQNALNEGYFTKLRNEYQYLAHKFSLKPLDYKLWKFLRLRPQNFPHIRLSQLSTLYYERKTGLSQLIECKDVFALQDLLSTKVSPYWETHYTFGSTSDLNKKNLSPYSINLLLINTCIPMLLHMDGILQTKRSVTVPSICWSN